MKTILNNTTAKIIIVWEKSFNQLKNNILKLIQENINNTSRLIWI